MTFVSLHAIEPWSRGQRRVDGVRFDGMGARHLISTQVTGHLLIEMPKINENAPTLFGKSKARAEKEERLQRLNGEWKPGLGAPTKKKSVGVHAKPLDNRRPALSASMADLMVKDSSSRRKADGMAAVSTRRVDEPPPPPPAAAVPTDDDDDEPPPPC